MRYFRRRVGITRGKTLLGDIFKVLDTHLDAAIEYAEQRLEQPGATDEFGKEIPRSFGEMVAIPLLRFMDENYLLHKKGRIFSSAEEIIELLKLPQIKEEFDLDSSLVYNFCDFLSEALNDRFGLDLTPESLFSLVRKDPDEILSLLGDLKRRGTKKEKRKVYGALSELRSWLEMEIVDLYVDQLDLTEWSRTSASMRTSARRRTLKKREDGEWLYSVLLGASWDNYSQEQSGQELLHQFEKLCLDFGGKHPNWAAGSDDANASYVFYDGETAKTVYERTKELASDYPETSYQGLINRWLKNDDSVDEELDSFNNW